MFLHALHKMKKWKTYSISIIRYRPLQYNALNFDHVMLQCQRSTTANSLDSANIHVKNFIIRFNTCVLVLLDQYIYGGNVFRCRKCSDRGENSAEQCVE